MGLMKRMLDHIGFDAALKACGLPAPQSNRGYRPEQLIVQFMLSIWCGANRFEHGEVTRHDPVSQPYVDSCPNPNFTNGSNASMPTNTSMQQIKKNSTERVDKEITTKIRHHFQLCAANARCPVRILK